MDDLSKVAYIYAMIACAQIEMAGMVAENEQRKHLGQSMAFVSEDFDKLANKYGIHHNAILDCLR